MPAYFRFAGLWNGVPANDRSSSRRQWPTVSRFACIAIAIFAVFCSTGGDRCGAQLLPGLPAIPNPFGGAAAPANAIGAPKEEEEEALATRHRFVRPDRSLLRLMDQAQTLIEDDRHADAIRCLGAILEHPNDYLTAPGKDGSSRTTLKQQARDLIRRMPSASRRIYELQYGAQARRLLAEAAEKRDAELMARVVVCYFHTEAGNQAAMLLGLHLLERGQYPTSANILGQLRDEAIDPRQFEPTLSLALATAQMHAGAEGAAMETLEMLRIAQAGGDIEIGDVRQPLFEENGDSLAWLESLVGAGGRFSNWLAQSANWLMYRASPDRNLAHDGASAPLMATAWRIRTAEYPAVEGLIEDSQIQMNIFGTPLVPSSHPLAVGDVVLLRTVTKLVAVDINTGKRLWESEAEDPFESFVGPKNGLASNPSSHAQAAQLQPALQVRLWGDATFGTLSSDGDRVYAIEGLGIANTTSGYRTIRVALPGGGMRTERVGPPTYNRLAARDVETGELLWEVGGPDQDAVDLEKRLAESNVNGVNVQAQVMINGQMQINGGARVLINGQNPNDPLPKPDESEDDEDENGGSEDATQRFAPLAGYYFLGAPLALDGELYVLAEQGSQIQLLALSPEDGALRWKLPLVDADTPISESQLRRIAGMSPSSWGGVLICPTSHHSVIAVDLATHSPLWGFTYAPSEDAHGQNAMLIAARMAQANGETAVRWLDSSIMIDGENVLVTPPDAQEIFCLSLSDGSLLWKKPRSGALCVACVHDGLVVLLTSTGLRALSLADGKDGWDGEPMKWAGKTRPSGQGFLADGLYFVPLSNGTVAAVDVGKGKVVQTTKSRTKNVPGNLICHDGRIISQRADAVEAFHQIDTLRRKTEQELAADANDADALCMRGRLAWNGDDLDQAIADFHRSLELADNEDTREFLRLAYFDGLNTDFEHYLPEIDRIESVVKEPVEQAELLRLLALGHESIEQWGDALDQYRRLLAMDLQREPVEIGEDWHARQGRWIGAQLAELQQNADESVAADIEALADQRLEIALGRGEAGPLTDFVESFGRLPVAEKAYRSLADIYAESKELTKLELLLEQRTDEARPDQEAAAVHRLARLYADDENWSEAAACYRWLKRHLPDAQCSPELTCAQAFEEALKNEELAKRIQRKPEWPVGRVDVKVTKRQTEITPNYIQMPGVVKEPRGPFNQDTRFILKRQADFALRAENRLGDVRWSLPLAGSSQPFRYASNAIQLMPIGHMLVCSTGQEIMAIEARDDDPRILWRKKTFVSQPMGYGAINMGMPFGGIPVYYSGNTGAQSWTATPTAICFVERGQLVTVDPVSGEEIWRRDGVGMHPAVFGDDDYLFVDESGGKSAGYGSSGTQEARVFRTWDGAEIGTREIPASRLATVGRNILSLENLGHNAVCKLIDPLVEDKEEQVLWKADDLDSSATQEVVSGKWLVTVSKKHEVRVFEIATGKELINHKLEVRKSEDNNPFGPGGYRKNVFWETSDGFMMLLVTNPMISHSEDLRIYQLSGVQCQTVGMGCLMAFDHNGKPMWDKPTPIERTHFILNQPADMPVTLFGARAYSMIEDEQGRRRSSGHETWLLGVDRRTGRVVLDHILEGTSSNGFAFSAEPDNNTMRIASSQATLDLTFTDEEPAPIEHTHYFTGKKPADSNEDATEEADEDASEEAGEDDDDRPLAQAIFEAIGRVGSNAANKRRTQAEESTDDTDDTEEAAEETTEEEDADADEGDAAEEKADNGEQKKADNVRDDKKTPGEESVKALPPRPTPIRTEKQQPQANAEVARNGHLQRVNEIRARHEEMAKAAQERAEAMRKEAEARHAKAMEQLEQHRKMMKELNAGPRK